MKQAHLHLQRFGEVWAQYILNFCNYSKGGMSVVLISMLMFFLRLWQSSTIAM